MTTNNNILYLREMGANDNSIMTDVKNHRVRVLENIDIIYKGEKYNMFFEFTQGAHWIERTTNKRTGAPLKKPITETIIKDGLYIDTEFERPEADSTGRTWLASYRKCDLECEMWEEHHEYTRNDILNVVNRYSIKKYNKVVLVEEETRNIINKIGGFREKDIIAKRDFQTEGDYYMEIGDTWTAEHKTVKVNRREWEETENGRKLVITNTCEVDLVTGKITG